MADTDRRSSNLIDLNSPLPAALEGLTLSQGLMADSAGAMSVKARQARAKSILDDDSTLDLLTSLDQTPERSSCQTTSSSALIQADNTS